MKPTLLLSLVPSLAIGAMMFTASGCSTTSGTSEGNGGSAGSGGAGTSGTGAVASGGNGTTGTAVGGSGAGGSGAGGSGAGGSGAGGSGGSAELPTCKKTCASPTDCVGPGGLSGADNYTCTAGFCEWLGCNSTDECVQDVGAAYGCGLLPTSSAKACYKTCASPADCIGPGGLSGADNYTCTAGFCEWLGCNSTDECVQDVGAAYGCD